METNGRKQRSPGVAPSWPDLRSRKHLKRAPWKYAEEPEAFRSVSWEDRSHSSQWTMTECHLYADTSAGVWADQRQGWTETSKWSVRVREWREEGRNSKTPIKMMEACPERYRRKWENRLGAVGDGWAVEEALKVRWDRIWLVRSGWRAERTSWGDVGGECGGFSDGEQRSGVHGQAISCELAVRLKRCPREQSRSESQ